MRIGFALAACVTAALACAPSPASAQPGIVGPSLVPPAGPDSYNVTGRVQPDATDTHYYFEWSDFGDTPYSYATPAVDIGTTPTDVSQTLRAVSDWTYHFNLHAYDGVGQVDGTDQTVTTPPYASKPGAPGDLDVAGTPTHSPGFAVQGRAGPTNDGQDLPGGGFKALSYPDDVANAVVVQQNGSVLPASSWPMATSTTSAAARSISAAGPTWASRT
jgi:hypothetical protein